MPETMTATFCERCGTRQEFRAPRGLGPIRKTRGFIGGLKNYIGGSDALSEAMREGMQAQESRIAAAQLDAFHASIHLCIDCRQYTCNDCWNLDAGRCRTCAPLVGVDDLADRIAASLETPGSDPAAWGAPAAVPVFDHPVAVPLPADSWPQADHEVYPARAVADDADGEAGYALAVVPSDDEFDAEQAAQLEVERLAAELAAEPEPQPEPVAAEAEPAPEDAVAAPPPLRVVAWDEDAPPLEAPEPFVEANVEPEPVAPTAAEEPEPAAADPLPAVPSHAFDEIPATAEFEPAPIAEPLAAELEEAAPASAPEPPFPAIPARPMPRRSGPMRDRVVRIPAVSPPVAPPARTARPPERVAAEAEGSEVAARRAQLELLGLDDTQATEPVTPDGQVVPYRSRGATLSNREATAAAIREGSLLWEASAREVDGVGVTVHSCDGCGLALSANARFCRRCGTRQAQSA